MKTTIEMNGYEIVIHEPKEGLLTVQALKGGEVIEEFELESSEEQTGSEVEEMEGSEDDEMMPFGEEESDFDEEEMPGEEMDEEEEEEGEEEEEMMGESKLESFSSFVKKRK